VAEGDVKKLEMRIARLENLVEKAVATREPVDVSSDELKAYQKVRDIVAADWGEFCGINDCFRCIIRCLRCYQCQVCARCDIECNCGPCSMGGMGGMSGGLGRFGGLGG